MHVYGCACVCVFLGEFVSAYVLLICTCVCERESLCFICVLASHVSLLVSAYVCLRVCVSIIYMYVGLVGVIYVCVCFVTLYLCVHFALYLGVILPFLCMRMFLSLSLT